MDVQSKTFTPSRILFECYASLRHQPSFPTRRSSDLSTFPLGVSGNSSRNTYPVGTMYSGNSRCSPRRSSLPLARSEEHTSELQSLTKVVCRLLLDKNNAGSPLHGRVRRWLG